MSVQENMSIVRKYYDAFNKRHFEEAEQIIDQNAEFVVPAFNLNLKGHEGYRQSVNMWDKAFPDGKIKITNMIPGEDFVAVEFTGSGNNTGILKTPEFEIKPTRKQVTAQFFEVINVRNGRIVRSAMYYDLSSILRQLGVLAEVKH